MLVVSSFRKSFLASKSFSQSFLWQNFTITCSFSLSQWQASKSSLLTLQSKLRDILHIFVSDSSINGVIRSVLNFLLCFYDKISQVQKITINIMVLFRIRFYKYKKAPKSTKKHNQYIGFFQDKISPTLNTLVFVQDKILYPMSS